MYILFNIRCVKNFSWLLGTLISPWNIKNPSVPRINKWLPRLRKNIMKTDTTLNNIVTESSPLENQPHDNFYTINWQYKAKIFYSMLGKCCDSKSRNANRVLRLEGEKIDSANYRINFMNRSGQRKIQICTILATQFWYITIRHYTARRQKCNRNLHRSSKPFKDAKFSSQKWIFRNCVIYEKCRRARN